MASTTIDDSSINDHSLMLESDANENSNSGEERAALAKKETKAVSFLRLLVLALLGGVALAVSLLTYQYTKGTEQATFEDAVQDHADKILKAFVVTARERQQAILGFSDAITSHALFAETEFPNVILPDFERRATRMCRMADVIYVEMAMLVTEEHRDSWEDFSMQNQGWLMEGLAQQEVLSEERLQQQAANLAQLDTREDLQIPPSIYRVDGLSAAPENGPGPYLANWQLAPAIPVASLVNFNVFSHPATRDAAKAAMMANRCIVGTTLDYSDTSDPEVAGIKWVVDLYIDRSFSGTQRYRDDPGARMLTPIYDSFNETSRRVVGVLTTGLYWRTYFTNILPDSAKGVYVVLENSCNQTFTYILNGPNCDYLGPGDLHDSTYDDYEYSTEMGAFLGREDGSVDPVAGECRYGLRVYPSKETEEQFMSNLPLAFTLSLVAVFMFTSLVFVTYDFIVERRQQVVLTAAIQAGTIVSSLFPKQVRDQMYADAKPEKPTTKDEFKWRDTLSETPSSMAQLYPNCTVFFADIVGFTFWSSSRSPEQVFQLLETIYASFDKVAKRMGVYKIETIGDCYVAVTGLPKPQPDHAKRMVRFSAECLYQMNEQLQDLSTVLGPGTKSLGMRVGLNSGQVTAGVLRGERARFQLFGDTVNTATRMESNGEKGRIHVSPSTADLLIQGGKGGWLTKRQDLVKAKGKGTIQTYWAYPDSSRMSDSVVWTDTSSDGVVYHNSVEC